MVGKSGASAWGEREGAASGGGGGAGAGGGGGLDGAALLVFPLLERFAAVRGSLRAGAAVPAAMTAVAGDGAGCARAVAAAEAADGAAAPCEPKRGFKYCGCLRFPERSIAATGCVKLALR